jgi:hypothetical protein
VFPAELLPLPKADIRKWAYRYAALTVMNTGKLARFQQDGALCFTRFQPMTQNQWDAIRTDAIPDLVRYNAEMRDQGTTTAQLPSDIKAIIDAHRTEYKAEETALHEFLRSPPTAKKADQTVTVPLYIPVLMQSSRIITGLLFFLAFGVVQWFRNGGGFGVASGILGTIPGVENDYRLIVYGCIAGFIAVPVQVFYMILDKKGMLGFLLGILQIFPLSGNLYLLAFLGYMILYRGLWSLADLREGFSLLPFVRLLFFTSIGWFSYKAFCHLYQMGRMLGARENEKLEAYIQACGLNKQTGQPPAAGYGSQGRRT